MARIIVLGFTLLLLLTGSVSAFTLTTFAGAGSPYSDTDLGISSLTTEDFEDSNLAAGLAVGFGDLSAAASPFHAGNLASEPGLAWDGSSVLDLSTGPSLFPGHIITWFEVPLGTRSIGLAISGAPTITPDIVVYDGASAVFVHEDIGVLSGFQAGASVRNLYLRIDAEESDPDISRLRFDIFSSEGVVLDRVAFGAASAVPEPASQALWLIGMLFLTSRGRR